ncbi:hypothetical protein AAFF_G00136910 [Aldrovandia affinis]|uniref:Uncharacterized protein n=1 Tax=Aldrovandia affinis TaxID=143900 RepID=A0AAD7TC78_9TELE|nr:hypothetical protein AAFF_G00136910 [Aldrovandia affinis]
MQRTAQNRPATSGDASRIETPAPNQAPLGSRGQLLRWRAFCRDTPRSSENHGEQGPRNEDVKSLERGVSVSGKYSAALWPCHGYLLIEEARVGSFNFARRSAELSCFIRRRPLFLIEDVPARSPRQGSAAVVAA